MGKTREELEAEILLINKLRDEREASDKLYAIKLVERIVFALVSLLLLGVVGAIVKLVIN